MSKLFRAAAVVAALFLLAGVTTAADKKKTRPTAGKVKTVDAKDNKITLEGQKKKKNNVAGPDQTFEVAKDAKVTINGEAKTLSDVKAGDFANLTLSDDKKSATAISVGAAKKKKKNK
jgi:hypothetical protein